MSKRELFGGYRRWVELLCSTTIVIAFELFFEASFRAWFGCGALLCRVQTLTLLAELIFFYVVSTTIAPVPTFGNLIMCVLLMRSVGHETIADLFHYIITPNRQRRACIYFCVPHKQLLLPSSQWSSPNNLVFKHSALSLPIPLPPQMPQLSTFAVHFPLQSWFLSGANRQDSSSASASGSKLQAFLFMHPKGTVVVVEVVVVVVVLGGAVLQYVLDVVADVVAFAFPVPFCASTFFNNCMDDTNRTV